MEIDSRPTVEHEGSGGRSNSGSHPAKVRGGNRADTASMYAGNKLAAIKKEDGQPLMRKDIQFDFLHAVFYDQTKAFTSSYDPSRTGLSFADIYIEAMARSERTSNVLRDKLYNEKESALSMAMICLLVNLGRMNTTLNFFPEMRAQLRTYHAIPSLQAKNDPNAYKALQDAPRLKSILKGSCSPSDGAENQPSTLESLEARLRPRCNPIALIFVLAQYAPTISERHFKKRLDFFDLIMRTTLGSATRAKAFLWLVWWYLESDFSDEHAKRNPFGSADPPDDSRNGIFVPPLDYLTEEQAALENVDTQEEIEYGEKKRLERLNFSEQDAMHHYQITKRGPKKIGLQGNAMESGMHVIAGTQVITGTGSTIIVHNKRKHSAIDSGNDSPVNGTTVSAPPAKRLASTLRARPDPVPRQLTYAGSSTEQAGLQSRSRLRKPSPLPISPRGSWIGYAFHNQELPDIAKAKTLLARDPLLTFETEQGLVASVFANEDEASMQSGHRKRQPNSHQRAVQANRDRQVEYIIGKKLRAEHRAWRAQRHSQPDIVTRTCRRLSAAGARHSGTDSEEDDAPRNHEYWDFGPRVGYWDLTREERAQLNEQQFDWASGGTEPGWTGIAPVVPAVDVEDWGAEAAELEQGARRLWRRLQRWMGNGTDRLGMEIREFREEEAERKATQRRNDRRKEAAKASTKQVRRSGAVDGADDAMHDSDDS